jgi:hypothetical protein
MSGRKVAFLGMGHERWRCWVWVMIVCKVALLGMGLEYSPRWCVWGWVLARSPDRVGCAGGAVRYGGGCLVCGCHTLRASQRDASILGQYRPGDLCIDPVYSLGSQHSSLAARLQCCKGPRQQVVLPTLGRSGFGNAGRDFLCANLFFLLCDLGWKLAADALQ